MSRRGKDHLRCPRCRLHLPVCVCATLPRLETRTRLLVVMHRDEERKPTNTGRLMTLCLPNSEVVVRGNAAGDPSWALDPAYQPVLLFPDDDAVPLARFAGGARPVELIVPDGTWRQASKVRKRAPQLAGVPCVSLPPGAETRYRLRAERRDGGLATAEAIARAYGVLEGDAVATALLGAFDRMVEGTLKTRGASGTSAPSGTSTPSGTSARATRLP